VAAPSRPRFTAQSAPALALVGLVLAVIVAYAPLEGAGFVYDDHPLVEHNTLLLRPDAAVRIWSEDLSGAGGWKLYRPIAALTWITDVRVFGPGARGHHLANVAWHVLAALALYALVRELAQLFRREPPGAQAAALSAAALFALHPINSEAVAWISRRPDVLAGSFSLIALAASARWLRLGSSVWLVPAIVFSGAALLSKEVAIATPILILVLMVLSGSHGVSRASRRSRVVATASCVGLVAAYLAARALVLGTLSAQPVGSIQSWLVRLPEGERGSTALGLVGHYGRLILWPNPLSADYSWESLSPMRFGSPWVFVGVALIAGILAGIAVAWKRSPLTSFALAVLALTFAPVSNLVVPLGTSFAERLLYLPSAGAAMLAGPAIGAATAHGARARPLALALLVGVCSLLGARTFVRSREWKDDATLFGATLRHYPRNVVARTYAAIAEREHGNLENALAHYEAALAVDPEYHLGRVNRAILYLELGQPARAAEEARRVIAADPGPGAAHLTLGRAELDLGNIPEAIRCFEIASRDPRTREEAAHFYTVAVSRIR
jgi:hypothetical protein